MAITIDYSLYEGVPDDDQIGIWIFIAFGDYNEIYRFSGHFLACKEIAKKLYSSNFETQYGILHLTEGKKVYAQFEIFEESREGEIHCSNQETDFQTRRKNKPRQGYRNVFEIRGKDNPV